MRKRRRVVKKTEFRLSETQQNFVDEASAYLRGDVDAHKKFKVLKGYAGTGKSSVMPYLNKAVEGIVFAAPTHQAKNRLISLLGEDANVVTTTSLSKSYKGTREEIFERKIADALMKRDLALVESLNKKMEACRKQGKLQDPVFKSDKDKDGARIVVVDEAGMTSLNDRNAILENCDRVVMVGDGFQLPCIPPVMTPDERKEFTQDEWFKIQDWFFNYQADWNFTETFRNCGKILEMATLIRSDKYGANQLFPIEEYMESNADGKTLFHSKITPQILEACYSENSAMLSYMNDVVDRFSYKVREQMGFPEDEVIDEDVMYCNNSVKPFVNKDLVALQEGDSVNISDSATGREAFTLENWTSQTNEPHQALCNIARLDCTLSSSQKRELLSNKGLVLRFDYGRTVHSSQGSEWQNIFYQNTLTKHQGTTEKNRIYYTSLTRAKTTFTLLKP